ncbi:hypothetical protein [Sphingomonas sp.]|uniref:hypothetical protein n=1 Tax=Sphingomonas sp. TaxID=28214 RepID=UPI0017FCBE14|nr:hypothetical protein [Sphingomonas sp.]MBA4762986.1 hypothetical protein [Sphingomonas sp.]
MRLTSGTVGSLVGEKSSIGRPVAAADEREVHPPGHRSALAAQTQRDDAETVLAGGLERDAFEFVVAAVVGGKQGPGEASRGGIGHAALNEVSRRRRDTQREIIQVCSVH